MFGHDDKDEKKDEQVTGGTGTVVQPLSTTPPDENLVGVSPASTPTVTVNDAAAESDEDGDDDISKIVDDINANNSTKDQPAPPAVESTPAAEPEEPEAHEPEPEPTLSETPAELVEVKKSALQELSPLLDELDQPADEKLNILMMTIQATDDQALLPQALETAKKIENKKARAEAMLDIIQEINYFTKKQ